MRPRYRRGHEGYPRFRDKLTRIRTGKFVIVEFTTVEWIVISARRVFIPNGVRGKQADWFKIVLPEKMFGIFNRAVGKESKVQYIGTEEPPFHDNFVIVLDESENLEQLKVDVSVLVGT